MKPVPHRGRPSQLRLAISHACTRRLQLENEIARQDTAIKSQDQYLNILGLGGMTKTDACESTFPQTGTGGSLQVKPQSTSRSPSS